MKKYRLIIPAVTLTALLYTAHTAEASEQHDTSLTETRNTMEISTQETNNQNEVGTYINKEAPIKEEVVGVPQPQSETMENTEQPVEAATTEAPADVKGTATVNDQKSTPQQDDVSKDTTKTVNVEENMTVENATPEDVITEEVTTEEDTEQSTELHQEALLAEQDAPAEDAEKPQPEVPVKEEQTAEVPANTEQIENDAEETESIEEGKIKHTENPADSREKSEEQSIPAEDAVIDQKHVEQAEDVHEDEVDLDEAAASDEETSKEESVEEIETAEEASDMEVPGSEKESESEEESQLENEKPKDEKSETEDKLEDMKAMKFSTLVASRSSMSMMALNAVEPPTFTHTNKAARVKNKQNKGFYKTLTAKSGDNFGALSNMTLFINQHADYKGSRFYKIYSGLEGPYMGWIKESDLNLYDLSETETHNEKFLLADDQDFLFSQPWGTSRQRVGQLDKFDSKNFKAEKVVKLGMNKHYYGKVGSQHGWVHEYSVKKDPDTPRFVAERKAARVKKGNNSGIYKALTSDSKSNYGKLDDSTLYINQYAEYKGEKLYKIYSGIDGGYEGWVNEKDLNLYDLSKTETHEEKFQLTDDQDFLFTDPWGTANQRIGQLDKYDNSLFNAEKVVKLGMHNHYYGKIGSAYGWVHQFTLQPASTKSEFSNIQKTASVAEEKDSGLYLTLTSSNSRALSDYTGKTLYVGQTTRYNGADFYKTYTEQGGRYLGWIKERDLNISDYVQNPSPSSDIEVETVKYEKSLDEVLDIQMGLRSKPQVWMSGGGWRNASRSEVKRYLDTSNHDSSTWDYTFLNLDRPQGVSSAEINSKLLNNKGVLTNQGVAFTTASLLHGVNEVYLLSHALHETGNGSSQLAQGVKLDANGRISESGKTYYNFYGVGAYDYKPVLTGAQYAQQRGWDTPEKAIIGGAQFISRNYFNRGQNTLYSMRWNPLNPGSYQYATDVNWAYATARSIENYYRQLQMQGQYYTKHTF